jgi:hypothetical protein
MWLIGCCWRVKKFWEWGVTRAARLLRVVWVGVIHTTLRLSLTRARGAERGSSLTQRHPSTIPSSHTFILLHILLPHIYNRDTHITQPREGTGFDFLFSSHTHNIHARCIDEEGVRWGEMMWWWWVAAAAALSFSHTIQRWWVGYSLRERGRRRTNHKWYGEEGRDVVCVFTCVWGGGGEVIERAWGDNKTKRRSGGEGKSEQEGREWTRGRREGWVCGGVSVCVTLTL